MHSGATVCFEHHKKVSYCVCMCMCVWTGQADVRVERESVCVRMRIATTVREGGGLQKKLEHEVWKNATEESFGTIRY